MSSLENAWKDHLSRNYRMRAYDSAGAFAFGATLHAADDDAACSKFESLPLQGHRAELLNGARLVAVRQDSEALSPPRSSQLRR
jgi:hypothetical protein